MSTHSVSPYLSKSKYTYGERKTHCGIVIRDQPINLAESPTCELCLAKLNPTMTETHTYEVREVTFVEASPLYGAARRISSALDMDIRVQLDAHLRHYVKCLYTVGYRNDAITPVDEKKEKVTLPVSITLSSPATWWDNTKQALIDRWPSLSRWLTVNKTETRHDRTVTTEVVVARNVTVQFVDPKLAMYPESQYRRAFYGRRDDETGYIEAIRKQAAETVKESS